MKQKEFAAIIENHEGILKKLTGISNRVGYIKLLVTVLLPINVYFSFTGNNQQWLRAWLNPNAECGSTSVDFQAWFFMISIVNLIALITVWIHHHKIHKKIDFSNNIITINKRHLARIAGNWTAFSDIGEEFIDHNHPYSSDLDMVGQKSFFHFLNNTNTWHGRQAFANSLLQPQFSEKELIGRQKAIAELSNNIEFLNVMEHHFEKIGVYASVQKLVDELKDQQIFISNNTIKWIFMVMPLITTIVIIAAVAIRQSHLYIAAISLVAIQTVIWLIGLLKTQSYLSGMYRLPYKLKRYSKVIKMITGEKFESEKLRQIQSRLESPSLSASEAMKDLGKISDKVSYKYNAMTWYVVNALLLWDIGCCLMFQQWKQKYASHAADWFIALGEFESLLCFSNFPNVCGHTVLPAVTTEKFIAAQKLGHPLIAHANRVTNDFSCNNHIFIISGSNMSGKTTFMRTLGINLVLARTGSYVCAKKLTFPLIEIMTSMRIVDDLNEGISTFYAELKRIKGIIALAEKEPHMLFLIDEIFRGTNSVDRISGARTVLSKLDQLGVMGIITTHDLELCEIESARVKNYSFSEEYRDGKIYFDYKMKQGKSTTTNAKYLMQMVGISTAENEK